MKVIEVITEHTEGYKKGLKYVDYNQMFKNIIQQVFPGCLDSRDYNGVAIGPVREQFGTRMLGISLDSCYWENKLRRRVMISNGEIDEVALKAKYEEVRQHAAKLKEKRDERANQDAAKRKALESAYDSIGLKVAYGCYSMVREETDKSVKMEGNLTASRIEAINAILGQNIKVQVVVSVPLDKVKEVYEVMKEGTK